jgi:hypothetical protein
MGATCVTDTEIEMKTYEIERNGGAIRVTFPAAWKVTFGPAIGAAGQKTYGSHEGAVLRIWETDKLQRGLWTGVTGFRDVSMPVEVKAVRKFGSEEWRADDGTWTGDKAKLVEKQWVTADSITTDPETEPEEDDFGSVPYTIGRTRVKTR